MKENGHESQEHDKSVEILPHDDNDYEGEQCHYCGSYLVSVTTYYDDDEQFDRFKCGECGHHWRNDGGELY